MRPDRDHFVTINFENIDENAYPGATKNFELVSSSTHSVMNTPFDTSSIMMYGPHDFAKNDTTGRPLITLQPKEAGVDIRYEGTPLIQIRTNFHWFQGMCFKNSPVSGGQD